jgi:hypothetical protein
VSINSVALPMLVHPAYLADYLMEIQSKIAEIPQIECPVEHYFSAGVYTRKMFIPAGTIIVGKTHRFQTTNIIAQGDITVLTTKGMTRFKAPDVVISEAGIKKVGYAHKDTVWINVHPTDETDLEKIEELFIIKEDLPWLGQQSPPLQLV